MSENNGNIGVVVIGRNEGERLKQCIESILSKTDKIVYVDSGSSDGSVEWVKSRDVPVLQLDMSIPFSAARARNSGCKLLQNDNTQLEFIQFIDGDCQCCNGWLSRAATYLRDNKSVAVVAGRRMERYPEESIYNMLCDMEWDTPIGEAEACGGDFMVRKEAFNGVGGFNETVVAGEEPELCYRLRKKNWSIFRLDSPMTTHDAAISQFSQWWNRCLRAGHAYAQGFLLHLSDGNRYCFKESARIWFWALIFPVTILVLAVTVNAAFLLLVSAYLAQFIRIAMRTYRRFGGLKRSLIYSFFIVIGKWPELIGQLRFWGRTLLRRKYTIIEYN